MVEARMSGQGDKRSVLSHATPPTHRVAQGNEAGLESIANAHHKHLLPHAHTLPHPHTYTHTYTCTHACAGTCPRSALTTRHALTGAEAVLTEPSRRHRDELHGEPAA